MLVAGSIGIDDVKTPAESRKGLLGGSASYAAVAASFFSPVRLVGVVGEDFPDKYRVMFREKGIDQEGLKTEKGKTFYWAGEYFQDLNQRRTLAVELNVFERFQPELPPAYQDTDYVLLGNLGPALQSRVVDQVKRPRFIMADTMDFYIGSARPDLMALLKRVDAVCMNDGEARQLTGENNLIKAGKMLLGHGPKFAVIKKGEHGSLLFSGDRFFSAPAYPLEEVFDPTGAGDTFAGALAGYLASVGRTDFDALRQAVIVGSAVASFNVEAFSLERLLTLKRVDIDARCRAFRDISRIDEA